MAFLSFFSFVFYSVAAHLDLLSFPTRRSSDLPGARRHGSCERRVPAVPRVHRQHGARAHGVLLHVAGIGDRKSTRLNSSHVAISYAVFCLKKKKALQTKARFNTQGINGAHPLR